MKSIALILGLTISLSANAFQPYSPDDILVMGGSDGSTKYMTFSELELEIEDINNIQYQWCTHKAALAADVLADRGYVTRDEMLIELTSIKPKMKHYMWLEIERIVAEVHRYDSRGLYQMPQTLEAQQDIRTEEFQKCIVSGF